MGALDRMRREARPHAARHAAASPACEPQLTNAGAPDPGPTRSFPLPPQGIVFANKAVFQVSAGLNGAGNPRRAIAETAQEQGRRRSGAAGRTAVPAPNRPLPPPNARNQLGPLPPGTPVPLQPHQTYQFKFTCALTWVHTVFTLLGMRLFLAAGMFERKALPPARVLPLAAAFVAYIVSDRGKGPEPGGPGSRAGGAARGPAAAHGPCCAPTAAGGRGCSAPPPTAGHPPRAHARPAPRPQVLCNLSLNLNPISFYQVSPGARGRRKRAAAACSGLHMCSAQALSTSPPPKTPIHSLTPRL